MIGLELSPDNKFAAAYTNNHEPSYSIFSFNLIIYIG
jgi:hypothetical protein